MKYIIAIAFILLAAPVYAGCGWGTDCYNPPLGPQCHTIFVVGQGYQTVCQ